MVLFGRQSVRFQILFVRAVIIALSVCFSLESPPLVLTATIYQAQETDVVGYSFVTEALNPWFSVVSDEGRPISEFISVKTNGVKFYNYTNIFRSKTLIQVNTHALISWLFSTHWKSSHFRWFFFQRHNQEGLDSSTSKELLFCTSYIFILRTMITYCFLFAWSIDFYSFHLYQNQAIVDSKILDLNI